jgi:hypothetical protein
MHDDGLGAIYEVFRFQRAEAKKLGEARAHTGAVLAIQRMGGSLNLNCRAQYLA